MANEQDEAVLVRLIGCLVESEMRLNYRRVLKVTKRKEDSVFDYDDLTVKEKDAVATNIIDDYGEGLRPEIRKMILSHIHETHKLTE